MAPSGEGDRAASRVRRCSDACVQKGTVCVDRETFTNTWRLSADSVCSRDLLLPNPALEWRMSRELLRVEHVERSCSSLAGSAFARAGQAGRVSWPLSCTEAIQLDLRSQTVRRARRACSSRVPGPARVGKYIVVSTVPTQCQYLERPLCRPSPLARQTRETATCQWDVGLKKVRALFSSRRLARVLERRSWTQH